MTINRTFFNDFVARMKRGRYWVEFNSDFVEKIRDNLKKLDGSADLIGFIDELPINSGYSMPQIKGAKLESFRKLARVFYKKYSASLPKEGDDPAKEADVKKPAVKNEQIELFDI